MEANQLELLESILDTKKKEVKTDSYPMSIGELVGMYEKEEIILRPEYQRYFRWDNQQKSKLIESILIGLPLPSFFMSQDEKGRWEVVDGMQRLSTIIDFMGLTKDDNKKPENYSRFEKLSDGLFYLSDFKEKGWNDLSRRIQLDFKRTKIQITVLLRETNPDAKFELFQRLNSGGTSISGQELRNAILAGQNKVMLDWFEDLASYKNFVSVCGLSDKDKDVRFDMELVLRFMVFLSKHSEEFKDFNSIDIFLTHILRKLAADNEFDYDSNSKIFKNTFDKIYNISGEGTLKYRTNPKQGRFSISFFEAVALGIAQNINNLPSDEIVKNKIDSIGNSAEYKSVSGGGTNASSRIPKLLKLGREQFSNL